MEPYNLFEDLKSQIDDNRHFNIDKYVPEVPEDIRVFLGRLSMLHGVPYHYMVPDERLLLKYRDAPEGTNEKVECGALKFFWIDPLWVECLLDGALSIGEPEDVELLLKNAMQGNYMAEAFKNEMVAKFRKQLAGSYSLKDFRVEMLKRMRSKGINIKESDGAQLATTNDNLTADNGVPVEDFDRIPEPTNAQNNWRFTGFLMRSSLISGWPGLEIQAYGKDQSTDSEDAVHPLQLLRMEKVGEDTFFCLCEGIITRVIITQPPENLHFGIHSNDNGVTYEKSISDKTAVDNKQTDIDVSMRNMNTRVLNIEELTAKIKNTLNVKDLTSADFAIQMIATPIRNTLNLSWNHEQHLNSK